MKVLALILAVLLAACSNTTATTPSLARRSAEAIDPRVPVNADVLGDPADPALEAEVAGLLGKARSSAADFDAAVPRVRALAGSAGPVQSESWIAAQAALSELDRLRAPAAAAAADLDQMRAERARSGQPILAADLALLEGAAAELRAINERLAGTLDAVGAAIAR
ncbi:MAG: hypothetical protein ABI412_05305 [Sphingomicrobium sp.]